MTGYLITLVNGKQKIKIVVMRTLQSEAVNKAQSMYPKYRVFEIEIIMVFN